MFWAMIKLFFSFGIVCGLIFLSSKIMRQSLHLPQHRTKMKVLDQIKVSPKTTLSIVKVGSDYLLIGSGDQQCSLLKQLDPTDCNDFEQKIENDQISVKSWDDLLGIFLKRSQNEKEKE